MEATANMSHPRYESISHQFDADHSSFGVQPGGGRSEDSASKIEHALGHGHRAGFNALHEELSHIRRISMHNGRVDLNEFASNATQIESKLHQDGFLQNMHIEFGRHGRAHVVASRGEQTADTQQTNGWLGGNPLGGGTANPGSSNGPYEGRDPRGGTRRLSNDSGFGMGDQGYPDRSTDFGRNSGADFGRHQGADLRGNSNEQRIVNFFVGKGLSPEQAAGIAGNLAHESGSNPGQHERGGHGYGLAQWGGNRLRNLSHYAAESGTSVADLGTQLNFMWKEMNSSESGSLAAIQRTASASQASSVFEQTYERAGIKAYRSRNTHAQRILAQYHGGGDRSEMV
jgi:Phage tail lysozyme